MSIETTVLDFKLSNTFEEYEAHMNAPEQQAMFKEMGVKTFYIGKSLEDPKRATVMFQGPVNTCYDIFVNPETKPIVEASGHIYEGTIINRWISEWWFNDLHFQMSSNFSFRNYVDSWKSSKHLKKNALSNSNDII